ncbi:MAG: radical SAM protein [bacterium]
MNYYLFETGCRLNQSLTNRLAGDYESKGFSRVSSPKDADLILMGSCVVTAKAQNEFMRIYRKLRRENPFARIEVSGCLKNPDELEHDSEYVRQESILQIENPTSFRTRPEIVIQTGCNNFCSYCIVPYMRGSERSRSIYEINRDIDYFLERGAKEIVLTGVHIGKYRSGPLNLAGLLREIKKKNIYRVRLSSLDISEIDDELIEEIGRDNMVARFIHIPLQHTEDDVLLMMKRKYGKSEAKKKISRLSAIDGMRLGADIIYNFPAESSIDFENLLKTLYNLPISHFHLFCYSQRHSTLASYFKNAESSNKEKLLLLKELAEKKRGEYAESVIGRHDEILVESISGEFASGKSSSYLNCRVKKSTYKIGDVVKVLYKSFDGRNMFCEE